MENWFFQFFPSSDVTRALKIFQLKGSIFWAPSWRHLMGKTGKTSFPWSVYIGPKPGNSKPSISITLLYTKLHGPSNRIFVGSTALKALLKTLVYVVFTFIICQNTHSTNTTCAFNPLLQVCKWFGESVFITLVVTSSGNLSHQEKFTDISTFPWLGPSNFV